MAHIHDKIDFTVEVFVVHNNKVLLRLHDKYGIWLSVGGHIELDEDPNQAALREVKEEVGLEATLFDTRTYRENTPTYHELIPPMFLNRHNITDSHEHVCQVFFATVKSDVIINEGREASEKIHWFTKEELTNGEYKLLDQIVFYAQTALEKLGHHDTPTRNS